MKRIIDSFLNEMPARISQLKAADAKQDSDVLERVAHTIKGAAGNLSAVELSNIAGNLEVACKQKEVEKYSALCDDLSNSYIKVKERFEEF